MFEYFFVRRVLWYKFQNILALIEIISIFALFTVQLYIMLLVDFLFPDYSTALMKECILAFVFENITFFKMGDLRGDVKKLVILVF